MSANEKPPFRADHVGSLLRTTELLAAREKCAAGELEIDDLRAIEDEAIREAIRMQEEVGLRSVSDGELRRDSWHLDFIHALGGISQADEHYHLQFKNEEGSLDYSPRATRVTSTLTLPETIFGEAFSFLAQNASPTQTPKLTIPSPTMIHYREGDAAIARDAYPDIEEFWTDLARVYAQEVAGVYALGCRYLQMDDMGLAWINDPAQQERMRSMGLEPIELVKRYVATINRALADRPDDLTVTVHLCRGNNKSMWVAEGGYDPTAEILFGELEVDGYFLEFDDERSGGFDPLRFVPPSKRVVLGLVTTKRPQLEDADELMRRIEAATAFIDLEQLCLSPQCGFASTAPGNSLSFEDQAAKLRLVVDTAERVWGTA